MLRNNSKKSFTLIELLVVIAIVGILSGLIILTMRDATEQARIAKSKVYSNSMRDVLGANLVSEWKLDEGTGQEAIDFWNGGNNGRLGNTTGVDSNDPTWITSNCVFKNCLSFDGNDDRVFVPGSNVSTSNLAITGAITISVWVKFNTTGTDDYIIGRGTGLSSFGDYGYFVSRYSGTNIIYFDTYSTTVRDALTSSSAITDTNWHYIVATWDGSTNTNGKKLYIDGTLSNQKTSTISAIGQPNYLFVMGIMYGLIDEARVFNAIVSTSQIRANYLAGLEKLLANGGITKQEYDQRIAKLNSSYAEK